MGFDEVEDDASVAWRVSVTAKSIDDLALAISDHNPVHMSHLEAVGAGFKTRMLHGVGLLGIISSAVANKLPGAGSLLLKADATYFKPAYIGDELECFLSVVKKYRINSTIRFHYSIHNGVNEKLATGTLTVMVPKS